MTKKITVEQAQTLEMLNREMYNIGKKRTTKENAIREQAKSLYRIKEQKLYLCEAPEKSFKAWYTENYAGEIHGIVYNTATKYINTFKLVWSVKEFKPLPYAIACRCIAVCRDYEKKEALKELVKNGTIHDGLTASEVDAILKEKKLVEPKNNGNGSNGNGSKNPLDTESFNDNFILVNTWFIENCKDKKVLDAWHDMKEDIASVQSETE